MVYTCYLHQLTDEHVMTAFPAGVFSFPTAWEWPLYLRRMTLALLRLLTLMVRA